MKNKKDRRISAWAVRDLWVIAVVTIFVFILARFFNVFLFLEELFRNSAQALTYVDEIFTVLLTLSIGFAIFSWRRWKELKKEAAERIKAQEELIELANTKAEVERIIAKELQSEIEVRKEIETKIDSLTRTQPK